MFSARTTTNSSEINDVGFAQTPIKLEYRKYLQYQNYRKKNEMQGTRDSFFFVEKKDVDKKLTKLIYYEYLKKNFEHGTTWRYTQISSNEFNSNPSSLNS